MSIATFSTPHIKYDWWYVVTDVFLLISKYVFAEMFKRIETISKRMNQQDWRPLSPRYPAKLCNH